MASVKVSKKADLLQVTREEMARRLVACAVFFIGQHQIRLNKSNPAPHNNPSKPGEYPKKRTGFGQKSVKMGTTDLGDITRTLRVTVGYDALAPYMPHLEIVSARLGLVNTLGDLVPQLGAIVGKPIVVRS